MKRIISVAQYMLDKAIEYVEDEMYGDLNIYINTRRSIEPYVYISTSDLAKRGHISVELFSNEFLRVSTPSNSEQLCDVSDFLYAKLKGVLSE